MGNSMRQWACIAAFAVGMTASPAWAKKKAPAVTEAELKEADQATLRCLLQQVTELDDGKVDVSMVARVAVNMCRNYRATFILLVATSVGRRVDLGSHLAAAAERDTETASYFILKRRAAVRK